jgi:hypothetical protein
MPALNRRTDGSAGLVRRIARPSCSVRSASCWLSTCGFAAKKIDPPDLQAHHADAFYMKANPWPTNAVKENHSVGGSLVCPRTLELQPGERAFLRG